MLYFRSSGLTKQLNLSEMGDKTAETDDCQNDLELDYMLSDVGEFGKRQIIHCILMILPIVLSATHAVEFIVTSSTDDYRQVASLK